MSELSVLQVASSEEAFFEKQVEVLEHHGIDCTKLVVPTAVDGSGPRGVRAYLDLYRDLLSETAEAYDLVHANYGLVGPLALAQPIRPVVLTIWGSEVMGYSRRLDRITRFAAAHSDAVIAPNQAVAERLSGEHSVVPFGVDLDQFEPIPRDAARRQLGWDLDERIVVFPYDPKRDVKNYDLAQEVVSQAAVGANLRTVSGRPYAEMPYVLNAADAILVTSERESGPMVVREAAACNVPVVSRDVGFVRETLAEVENSYVGETTGELIAGVEAALRSAGRSNGRERVREFSTDRMADGILSVYQELLEEEPPTRDGVLAQPR